MSYRDLTPNQKIDRHIEALETRLDFLKKKVASWDHRRPEGINALRWIKAEIAALEWALDEVAPFEEDDAAAG